MKGFKKLAITLLSLLIVACVGGGLSACTMVPTASETPSETTSSENVSNGVNEGNKEPDSFPSDTSSEGAGETEKTVIPYSETSDPFKTANVKQAHQRVEDDDGIEAEYEAELMETYRLGIFIFLNIK